MDSFAWPVVVLLMVVVFLVLFKGQIGGAIDRMRSIKIPGVHAEADSLPTVQQQPQPIGTGLIDGRERLGTPTTDDLFTPIETETAQLIDSSVPDSKYHLGWALRLFATAAVQRDHEVTLRLIFASQLHALRHISRVGGRAKLSDLRLLYETASKEFEEIYRDFSFEQWWHFLTQRLLTVLQGDELLITPRGSNLLAHMATFGIRDPGAG